MTGELGGKAVDLAFIDGMHLFEYALRDFSNLERLCTPHSTILVHDCYPLDRQTADRERTTLFWSGDIWRLILLLKKYRPDLEINVIAAPPTGLGVIRNLDPASRVIADNLADTTKLRLNGFHGVVDTGQQLIAYSRQYREARLLP